MSKWIWIPIFLVVAFVGDRVAGYVLKQAVDSSEFRYSRMYTGAAQSDVVFLSNSRGLNFYQPFIEETSGLSTLNLSYNAMPADLGAVLLADYLDLYGPPKALVLDVTFLDRDNPELVQDFKLYGQYSPRIDSLVRLANDHTYWGTKISHLTRYGGEVAQRMFYYLGKSDEDWLLDRQIAAQVVQDTAGLEDYRIDIQTDRITAITKVLDRYRLAGTQVELVVNPYFPPFARTIQNLDSLEQAVTKATGLPVHDYSRSIQGVEYFGDYQHLNKLGAEKYLARLLADSEWTR